MRAANWSLSAICGGLGAVCLIEAYRLWAGWAGPGTMPLVVGSLFSIQSLLYIVKGPDPFLPLSWATGGSIPKIVLLAGSFAIYVAALPWVGFTLSTWIFTTVVARAVSNDLSWAKAAIIMAVLAMSSNYLFNNLLGASLPVNAYGF